MCDKDIVLEKSFYDKQKLSACEKLSLEIHLRVILQHTYFVWKSDINLYMADFINFGKLLADYDFRLTPFVFAVSNAFCNVTNCNQR